MKTKRYTEEQIIGFLREADAGIGVKDLCHKHGFSEASYYLWRHVGVRRDGGVGREAAQGTGGGEREAEAVAGREDAGERGRARSAAKKVVNAPARRELVHWMTLQGLSQREALRFIGMSASSFGYQPAADRNAALRERIVQLAQRHRRYGAGMIYLKLRQQGHFVNHKRVDRLYALEKLQIKPATQEGAGG